MGVVGAVLSFTSAAFGIDFTFLQKNVSSFDIPPNVAKTIKSIPPTSELALTYQSFVENSLRLFQSSSDHCVGFTVFAGVHVVLQDHALRLDGSSSSSTNSHSSINLSLNAVLKCIVLLAHHFEQAASPTPMSSPAASVSASVPSVTTIFSSLLELFGDFYTVPNQGKVKKHGVKFTQIDMSIYLFLAN